MEGESPRDELNQEVETIKQQAAQRLARFGKKMPIACAFARDPLFNFPHLAKYVGEMHGSTPAVLKLWKAWGDGHVGTVEGNVVP